MPVLTAGRLAALGEAFAQLPHEMRHLFENYDVSVPSALGDGLVQPGRPHGQSSVNGCANQPHVIPSPRTQTDSQSAVVATPARGLTP